MYNALPAGYDSEDEELDYMMAHLKIKRLEDITKGKPVITTVVGRLTRCRYRRFSRLETFHNEFSLYRCWHQWRLRRHVGR